MIKTYLTKILIILAMMLASASIWACDAAGPSAHIGNLMSVDEKKMTFTIRDAQSSAPITFVTENEKIIDSLKEAKGSILVNYEEDDGTLTAVGVTF